MTSTLVRSIVLNLVPMVLSLTVHEFAHALAADRLGDDTPRRQGRLTLSPLAHYDLVGTILVPIAAVFLGGVAFIGWARPVEFVPANLTRKLRMRTGSALVAAAGPLSNLVLATLSIGVLGLVAHGRPELLYAQQSQPFVELLRAMFFVNVGLFIFNLLPLPPLDGSRLLPRQLDQLQAAVAPYSFVLLLAVIYSDTLRQILIAAPINFVTGGLQTLFHVHVVGALS